MEASMGTVYYPDVVTGITEKIGVLKAEIPATMKGFGAMVTGAESDGALSVLEKEYIAMGIAIALRCDGCIGIHTQKLIKMGATRAQFEELLGVAIYMGGGPSLMYAAQAMQAWDQFDGPALEAAAE